MKITAVLMNYPPRSLVGAWITTHEFLRHMVERGHDVTVLTTHAHDSFTHEGVEVRSRDGNLSAVRGADVLLSHLGDDGATAGQAQRFNVPLVRLVHGSHSLNRRRLRKHRHALVVANSHATAAELGAVDAPVIVCEPPVRPELHRTTPGDRVTLINLAPAKGLLAWQLASLDLPDVSFLGVKGGWMTQHVSSQLGPNVEIMDSTADMREVWSRSRVLLMPSQVETWGRVGVEAMVSGIPVIAHPTPGLVESLGAAGIFVDRDDRAGWAREIARLQDTVEWAAASTMALERAAELDPVLSLTRFAEAVESL